MQLDQVILELQQIKKEHGNLHVFDADTYGISAVYVEEKQPGDFPASWKMPKKFVRIWVLK